MNQLLITMLQADAPAQNPGSGASMWIMLIALFAVMYFFMIRPQKKAQKEHQAYISSLKKGDKVVLQSGIYGKITSVGDVTVDVEISKDVTVKVDKNSLTKDPSVAAAEAREAAKNKEAASEQDGSEKKSFWQKLFKK